MTEPVILIIDDDQRMRELLRDTLAEEGFKATLCGDSRQAIEIISSTLPDIIITDLKMPHYDGIAILELAQKRAPESIVIMVTGYGTIETAVDAIRKGAYDYIQKPFEPDDFLFVVRRAVNHVRLIKENRRLRLEVEGGRHDNMVGDSPPMLALKEMINRIAPFDTTVLIEGETGTGKEIVARTIHTGSRRNHNAFLAVNCGAIAEQLLESELFGHEKGAFTGADSLKQGLFEAAGQGTLFLDEINTTSENFQIKLLRVLQEGQVMRVGSTQATPVDVRIIAASNKPLEKEMEDGRFRRDLFYRLNVVTMELPPLRRRSSDIPLLAQHFMHKYAAKYKKEVKNLNWQVQEKLRSYHWPGNVRELENVIERAVLMAESDHIQSVYLPKKTSAPQENLCSGLMTLEEMESLLISNTLEAVNGHRERTAEILGISAVTLWRKVKKYQLS